MKRLLIALAALLILPGGQVLAHKMAPALLKLSETAPGVYSVHWKTPAVMSTARGIDVTLPANCQSPGTRNAVPDPVGLVWEWTTDCGGEGLVDQKISFSGLRENQSAVLLRIDMLDGREYRQMVNAGEPQFVVPQRADRFDVMMDYLVVGFEHILEGIDHLFFVWALILLLALRKLLWAVTAFTLGHSITLAAAALGVISVPQTLTEIFIALSILFLAAELADKERKGLIHRYAFLVCIGFGLLHGLGFASALSEIGLPQEELVAALLMFNVGVELGQIAFIFAVLAIAWLLRMLGQKVLRSDWQPAELSWIPMYVIGSSAAFWTLERTLG
jgi:hypothetical protein